MGLSVVLFSYFYYRREWVFGFTCESSILSKNGFLNAGKSESMLTIVSAFLEYSKWNFPLFNQLNSPKFQLTTISEFSDSSDSKSSKVLAVSSARKVLDNL